MLRENSPGKLSSIIMLAQPLYNLNLEILRQIIQPQEPQLPNVFYHYDLIWNEVSSGLRLFKKKEIIISS